MITSVAIVGASLAGTSTARELRRLGFEGTITLIGDEPHRPYDRPPLSKAFLAGTVTFADLALVDGGDEEIGADCLLANPATSVTSERDELLVRLADGSTVTADAVVVATGARARTLIGSDLAGVHTLRTLDEAIALRASLAAAGNVVVIGAGFIGAEVASTACDLGAKVTVVEASLTPLAPALGPELAAVCARLHAGHGVSLLTGAAVETLIGSDRVRAVQLGDGRRLDADAVVIGIGTIPNTEWARTSGLAIDDGFLADRWYQTAVPRVWAIGDCARILNHRTGTYERAEHWSAAVDHAKSVAAQIMEVDAPPPALPYFWSDQYGRRLQYAGRHLPGDSVELIDGSYDSDAFTALYMREQQPVGVFASNSPRTFTKHRKSIERAER